MSEASGAGAERDRRGRPATLLDRVSSWLEAEGYPTEFRTANIFQKHGFHARQGEYVRAGSEGLKREIDVVASITARSPSRILRLSYVVECKWSGDKPWVVFTSLTTQMAPSACIAQTISSKLGEAIVWAIAGNETLHSLETFSTPKKGGFGGRQAFSKGNDAFYSAVQAAVNNSISYVSEYDRRYRKKGSMPDAAVVAFPLVLVEGDIFVAYFDGGSGEVKIEPTDYVRCHWHGSPEWEFFATLDVVSMKHLDAFVKKRAEEAEALLLIMMETYEEVERFCSSGSLADLTVTPGPRGFIGAPSLVREFLDAHRKKPGSDAGDGGH
jgi:hypothetical protein